MNNMKTKAGNARANARSNGQTFAEILGNVLGEIEKKMLREAAMIEAIDTSMQEINEELKQLGDMVMGSTEIMECPCERNCGAIKIEVDFIAVKFEAGGMHLIEGKKEVIITPESV